MPGARFAVEEDGDRPVTEVYQRSRSVTESTLKFQSARTPRDRLLEAFSDGKFHSAYELQNLKLDDNPKPNPSQWYTLMGELIGFGHAFSRRSNSFIIRRRSMSEPPQDLAELFAKIDATSPEDVNHFYRDTETTRPMVAKQLAPEPSDDAKEPTGESQESDMVFPGGDGITETPPTTDLDRMVISVAPDGCVLRVKNSVTATRAILARKSSGKTYLAMVIAEELLKSKHKAPFTVIDPTGVWYGISAKVDGTASDFPVVRLGGTRAHFPIAFDQGSQVADVVAGCWQSSFVIDISDLMPDEQHQFVADFGSRLYTVNKKAMHLFVDEADEFAPQTVSSSYPQQKRSLGALDRLVRRGRVKGVGVTLITQRPAVIHKNLLSQVDGIFVLNVLAPHDIAAIESWMKPVVPHSMMAECLFALPKLVQGEAFFMQSGLKSSPPLVRFMTRPKITFDSSRTPAVDEPEPKEPELSSPERDVLIKVAGLMGVKLDAVDATSDGAAEVANGLTDAT